MTALLEVGQEWFHKKTLTPVAITAMGYAYVAVKSAIGPALDVLKSELSEHYARNEPVTTDLLRRLGWFNTNCDSEYGVSWDFHLDPNVDSRLVLDVAANVVTRAFIELHGRTGRSLGFRQIEAPATLRDLLNVLRVCGIKDSITPAATETEPTVKA